MARLSRYSRWDGTQAVPDLDADQLLSAMSDDLLADGDLWNALRRLFQRGAQDPQGGRMPGLQDLLKRLKQERQQRLEQYDLGSALEDIKKQLADILKTERAGIERDVPPGAQQEQKLQRLDAMPPDPAGQIKALQDHPFTSAEAKAKFDESIDVAVQLGIDAKKSDQVVRGAVVLPNGTGKTKRVAVFAQGAKADEAKAAGADIVGMDDLAAQIKAGNLNFDIVIASPDTMRVVGTLGQILGPRGLMPNPKVGTVTPDVATAVKNAKAGQVQYRVDKAGIVHATIGRRSFESDKLRGNLVALLDALNKSKPSTVKGIYLRKLAVSSTMGVGVRIDPATLTA